MAWRYSTNGQEMERPSAKHGVHIDGPLSTHDLQSIIEDLVLELVDQAKVEAKEEAL